MSVLFLKILIFGGLLFRKAESWWYSFPLKGSNLTGIPFGKFDFDSLPFRSYLSNLTLVIYSFKFCLFDLNFVFCPSSLTLVVYPFESYFNVTFLFEIFFFEIFFLGRPFLLRSFFFREKLTIVQYGTIISHKKTML